MHVVRVGVALLQAPTWSAPTTGMRFSKGRSASLILPEMQRWPTPTCSQGDINMERPNSGYMACQETLHEQTIHASIACVLQCILYNVGIQLLP